MKMLLVLLALASGLDSLVKETTGAVEVDCPEDLCTICQSETAYSILNETSFQIEDYVESVSSELGSMINLIDQYVKNATYIVTIGPFSYCVNASDFSPNPDLSGLYDETLGVSYISINSIEIFDISPSPLSIIATAVPGSGVGYSWESLHTEFLVEDSVSISSFITATLNYVWQIVERDNQSVKYEGETSYLDEEFTNDFIIQTQYDREDNAGFTLEISNTDSLLGTWADILDGNAKCSEIVSPRGINYIQELFPLTAAIEFENGSQTDFDVIRILFDVPEFSINVGMFIQQPTGILELLDTEEKCYLEIKGRVDVADRSLALVITGDKEEYRGAAQLYDDPKQLRIKDLEPIIKEFLYNTGNVLPVYEEEGAFIGVLGEVMIVAPKIEILFYTEPYFKIKASTEITEYEDGNIDMFIGRIQTNVVTCFTISDLKPESLFNLLGIEHLEYLTIDDISLNSSTETVSLQSTVFDVDKDYKEGVLIDYNIDSIENFELEVSFPLAMKGEYYPNNFRTKTHLDYFLLTEDINATSVTLTQLLEPYMPYYLSSILTFQDLKFDSNITLYSTNYTVNSYLQDYWNEVQGIPTLTIDSLELHLLVEEETVVSQKSKGNAHLSCEEDTNCWNGQVSVKFDFEKEESFFDFYLNQTEGEYLWESIFLLQPTALSTALSLESGLVFKLFGSDSYNCSAPVSFMNVPSYLMVESTINATEVTLNFSLLPFRMGFGNIRIDPQSNDLLLTSDGYTSQGEFTANVDFLGMQAETSISVLDNSLTFKVSEKPFKGIYTFELTVASSSPYDVYDSIVLLYGELEDSSFSEVSSILSEWVESGVETLETAEEEYDDRKEALDELTVCEEDCPTIVYCTSPLEQTCGEYGNDGECSEPGDSCSSVDYTCETEAEYCIDESCTETYTVCTNWTSTCEEGQEGCNVVTFGIIQEVCVFDGFNCEEKTIYDPTCLSDCIYKDLLYEESKEIVDLYKKAYDETVDELKGFSQLAEVDVGTVKSIKIDFEIEATGIGPQDLLVVVEYEYYSLLEELTKSKSVVIEWDYYVDLVNINTLVSLIKSSVIDDSGGFLSSSLVSKSPEEVYLENF